MDSLLFILVGITMFIYTCYTSVKVRRSGDINPMWFIALLFGFVAACSVIGLGISVME